MEFCFPTNFFLMSVVIDGIKTFPFKLMKGEEKAGNLTMKSVNE